MKAISTTSILFASIVCALGVTSCGQAGVSDEFAESETETDLDLSAAAPDDDPSLDDAAGLESFSEAAIEDAITREAAGDEVDDVELDVDDPAVTLASKRVGSPVPGRGVTYAYGIRNPRYAAGFHTGQDHAAPTGTPVVAVRSGKIRWSNNAGGAYGRWMGLDANNGRTYVYCHLSTRRFKAGTVVKAGQRIGRVGATGNVTGPHLHFEDHPKGPFRYAQVRKPRW